MNAGRNPTSSPFRNPPSRNISPARLSFPNFALRPQTFPVPVVPDAFPVSFAALFRVRIGGCGFSFAFAPVPDAFICDFVRTPVGRFGGALAGVRADDLAAVPLRDIVRRNPNLDPAAVDEVVLGCANQAGEDNRNLARMAALLADFPPEVSALTVNRLCASGMDAVAVAARAVSE